MVNSRDLSWLFEEQPGRYWTNSARTVEKGAPCSEHGSCQKLVRCGRRLKFGTGNGRRWGNPHKEADISVCGQIGPRPGQTGREWYSRVSSEILEFQSGIIGAISGVWMVGDAEHALRVSSIWQNAERQAGCPTWPRPLSAGDDDSTNVCGLILIRPTWEKEYAWGGEGMMQESGEEARGQRG
ncbi:uncharacterized protein BBA_06760 [Beauveria bassiana ARSEF 2860]|uniref:Uncharacterized protein n=1 Tax=Beauveria bassiana (strain ARSEF 2860) TaxID=655819 RepID=J5JEX2_BEAB2|nr:uncharacterized protein BBA_06760 [Beauveria bassiana ARSEF 2860]EJP64378.1 hypothetical protein BBA_06760 [Beauveria bassiana ARSEF 2860]